MLQLLLIRQNHMRCPDPKVNEALMEIGNDNSTTKTQTQDFIQKSVSTLTWSGIEPATLRDSDIMKIYVQLLHHAGHVKYYSYYFQLQIIFSRSPEEYFSRRI